jgi:hypothetical protein
MRKHQGGDVNSSIKTSCPASGTLTLKKCSTLPSKPFFLAVATPTPADNDEGRCVGGEEVRKTDLDLRLKILGSYSSPCGKIRLLTLKCPTLYETSADKAATSPSQELSSAVQNASWDLDAANQFEVHLDLDPARFSSCETSIKWVCKEKWEDDVCLFLSSLLLFYSAERRMLWMNFRIIESPISSFDRILPCKRITKWN